LAFTASVAETPKRLGFEEISSFPKILEIELWDVAEYFL